MDLQRACGWCGTHVGDSTATNCPNCGGPLPALPTTLAGHRTLALAAPPPPTPRQLPDTYRKRVLLSKNVLVILGGVFTLCFGWTVIFALVGIPLFYVGWTRAQKKLRALQDGRAAEGRVVEIEKDYSVKIGGRSPWKIVYRYEAGGRAREGWVHAWERPLVVEDDPVWVLWGPEEADSSCLWPPVQ